VKSKGKFKVFFDVTFNCANDAAMNTRLSHGHEDFRYTAAVDHTVIDGHADTHTADDNCPRSVTPPYEVDPNPNGTIKDKGCGSPKSDGTFGADVITDVFVKP
jgi:hypothetical protein